MPRSIRFVTQYPVDPLSPCGAVTTIPCPKISPEEYLNDAERWDPVRFYSIFGAPVPIVLARWSESIRPGPGPRFCTSHGSMIDSVLPRASATPGPSSFPLILQSWKPQARTSILTCCVATEPKRTPSFPDSRSPPCACASVHSARTRPGLSAAARVVSGAGLWYSLVQ